MSTEPGAAVGPSVRPVLIGSANALSARRGPHNLFSLAEVIGALHLLAQGLAKDQAPLVTVLGSDRTRACWDLDELSGLADVEQVRRIEVDWQYGDGSRVRGRIVDNRAAADLSATGGPAAHSARAACLDQLDLLRPQRAQLRGFFAGDGVHRALAMASAVLLVVIYIRFPGAIWETWRPERWPHMAMVYAVEVPLWALLMRRMTRGTAGTRLARPLQVQRKWLTTESNTAAAWLAAAAAVIALVTNGS